MNKYVLIYLSPTFSYRDFYDFVKNSITGGGYFDDFSDQLYDGNITEWFKEMFYE